MASERLIEAVAIEGRLVGLSRIGKGPYGWSRLAWSEEDAVAAEWFHRQAEDVGLGVERDPAGNLWACPDAPEPWWAVGSHLDTVRYGGEYDGGLGVACAFEIAARSEAPICVISFADEEGARFNTPTFGSRALAGSFDYDVLEREDADGLRLRRAISAAGLDPDLVGGASAWLRRLRGFLELHVDQTPELHRAHEPIGVVRGIAARTRLRCELTGRAGHAGTTPRADRSNALEAAARLISGAEELATKRTGTLATASRIEVWPNATTTIPARTTFWLDARSREGGRLLRWRQQFERLAGGLAGRTGVDVELVWESESPEQELDRDLRERLEALAAGLGARAREMFSYAGHDAAILATRLPTAIVLVRNPSGVSHAPDEAVDMEAAALGAELLRRCVEDLVAGAPAPGLQGV